MFTVRLADLNIQINNKYEYIKSICADYIIDSKPDFCVEATELEIEAERESQNNEKGFLEALAIYRKISEKLIDFNGFLMHGAVISLNDCGIAFLAKSGTGKTTHMNSWLKLFGSKVTVINGDKPLLRFIDGKLYAYGTPWSGKERLNTNTKTELKCICFIERATANTCCYLDDSEIIFEKLITQVYLPKKPQLLKKTLEFLQQTSNKCNFYLVKCNTDITACQTVYKTIFQGEKNERFRG